MTKKNYIMSLLVASIVLTDSRVFSEMSLSFVKIQSDVKIQNVAVVIVLSVVLVSAGCLEASDRWLMCMYNP